MKKLLLVRFCLLILFSANCFAQVPDTLWTKSFGETSDGGSFARSIRQTSDSGFIITGESRRHTPAENRDIYIAKTNSSGDTLWTKAINYLEDEEGLSIQETFDGGFIIVGYTEPTFGPMKGCLVKTNPLGDPLWVRVYDNGDTYSWLSSIQPTSDSGFIITGAVGTSGLHTYIIRTNSSGDTLWTRVLGEETGTSIQQTTDNGFIITGRSSLGNDIYLMKTNSSGNTLWTKYFGRPGYEGEEGFSVQQTYDNGFIISSISFLCYGDFDSDIYLIKTDSLGNKLWEKSFGGINKDEVGNSIQQTSDGGFIVAGKTNYTIGGNYEVYVLKINSSGDTLWTRTFGTPFENVAFSAQVLPNNKVIIAGLTKSAEIPITTYNTYLIMFDNVASAVEEDNGKSSMRNPKLTIWPNPFTNTANIRLSALQTTYAQIKIYDVSGKLAMTKFINSSNTGITLDGKNLKAGIYFVTLRAGNYKETRKLVLMR